MQPWKAQRLLVLVWLAAVVAQPAPAQQAQQADKPKPDLPNVAYGPHERNVLDLWKAPSPL